MTGIGEIERKTQNRVVALVKDSLGYEHLGDLTEYDNENIIEAQLRKSLKDRGYSTVLVDRYQVTCSNCGFDDEFMVGAGRGDFFAVKDAESLHNREARTCDCDLALTVTKIVVNVDRRKPQ